MAHAYKPSKRLRQKDHHNQVHAGLYSESQANLGYDLRPVSNKITQRSLVFRIVLD